MKVFGSLACLLLSAPFALAANRMRYARQYGGGYGGGYGDSGAAPASPSTPASSSTPGGASTSVSAASANGTVTGDSVCRPSMCIAAEVQGDNVQYTITSQRGEPGWMGIGFGERMVGSPMIVMWANADGTLTLSQRQATAYAEPAVVPNPPRVATIQQSLSTASGSDHKYVFTIPANTDTSQNIIWAFGTTKPASADVDARLTQHATQGRVTLNLAKTGGSSNTTTPGSNAGGDAGSQLPLTSSKQILLAQAVLACVGFLIL